MAARAPLPSLTTHLQSVKAPWSSLLVLKVGQRAESLVDVPDGFVSKVLRGSKCRTSAGLFAEFARALDFPDYFGHNWDALEECLADLEWLPAKGYVLILTDAEQVLQDDEADYATLLEVLSDAGEAWGSGQAGMGSRRATPFHVVFAVGEREKSKRGHWSLQELPAKSPRKPAKPTNKRTGRR
ncbi:MAG TPA: barstar family protein [Nitrospira sp.]|nr:barstar family protein [Nitrospira sp.]